MPIYGYECDSCGHHFEVMQKVTDEPMKRCPDCHKLTLRKRLYPVGVVFKGSGFYTTDYKGKGSGSSPSSSESKGESKSEAKSESKGETKSESKGSDSKTSD